MNTKPFKLIIFIENVLCLYRNYTLFSKRKRVIIAFRIFLELLFVLTHIITHGNHYKYDAVTDNVYFYLITCNSIVLILLALHHSKKFRKLLLYVNAYYTHFHEDEEHTKQLKYNQKVIVFMLATNIIIRISAFIYYQEISASNLYYSHLFYLNLIMCDTRYLFEFPFLYSLLYVISEELNGIARSVDKEILLLVNTNRCISECGKKLKIFDKWSSVYQNIMKTSKLFNSIFGLQITVMLATIIMYYIILLYAMTQLSVTGIFVPVMQFLYSYSLTVFLISLYMLSQAAQRSQNNSDVLRRKLSTLLVHSVSSEKYYKATKDLLRLVSIHPIRTQAFGSINVDMSLLPTCVAFCTSYTVIALQFSNVL